MKSSFKLFWVETPSPNENCFVAAQSNRAAAKYEEDGTGFDHDDCEATEICGINDSWLARYRGTEILESLDTPFYVQPEDLHPLDVKWRIVEGDDVFEYGGQSYLKQGDLNYLASLGDPPSIMVIRTVADLLGVIRRDNKSDWIFRGQSSAFWNLAAGAHRLYDDADIDLETLTNQERWLLNEFKRRARIFLQSPPSSNWEWMVLAQHFGLPTRMLDWTENPLVALYFSVKDQHEVANDGMLFAFRHGLQEIDIESTSDPFAIKQIELVRPPHLDQRVIVQQSVFTAEPPQYKRGGGENSDLRYWYVSVNHKAEIRNELAMLGISESTLFPGLTSLSAEIKRELLRKTLSDRT